MEGKMAHIFNTAGIGGLVVIIILGAFLLGYFFTLKWIIKAGK